MGEAPYRRFTAIGVVSVVLGALPARLLTLQLSQWDALGNGLRAFDVAFAAACVALAVCGLGLLIAPRASRSLLLCAAGAAAVLGGGVIVGTAFNVVPCWTPG